MGQAYYGLAWYFGLFCNEYLSDGIDQITTFVGPNFGDNAGTSGLVTNVQSGP